MTKEEERCRVCNLLPQFFKKIPQNTPGRFSRSQPEWLGTQTHRYLICLFAKADLMSKDT